MDEHCRGCIRYMKSCSGMSKRLCEKHKLRIPITSAERIRSMSDEELAELLASTDGDFPPNCEDVPVRKLEAYWLDWMKQEAEE